MVGIILLIQEPLRDRVKPGIYQRRKRKLPKTNPFSRRVIQDNTEFTKKQEKLAERMNTKMIGFVALFRVYRFFRERRIFISLLPDKIGG